MLTLEALDREYSSVTRQVRIILLSRNVPYQDLDDLLQQTWYKVWKTREQYRGDCSLRHWVVVVAWNIWRMSKRRPDYEVQSKMADRVEYPTIQSQIEVQELLAGLRPAERLILTRAYVEGYMMSEIATELHTSLNTAKTRILRARAKARRCVQIPSEIAKRQLQGHSGREASGV